MALVDDVATFVAELVPHDAKAWCVAHNKGKIIHDSLWGTFHAEAHEIALLDTPLLQRLRFVRQTGAVYLTYPSALHTRFEHTLGVLYKTARLCHALRRDHKEARVDQGFEQNIRCAAIFHDTGHGAFSHTSEQYFSAMPAIAEIKERDPSKFEDSGAGEILSYLILNSEPVRKLIQAINNHFKVALDVEQIGRMITGTFDDANIYRSEIIHGPFDADKLDYMPRDGMFSGLKMHVDIDRLFHSIDIREGRVRDKAGNLSEQSQTRLTGSIAGISPLTQIMFNKMLLFTGIYHHHKVRTVDSMLWAIFDLAIDTEATVGGIRLQSPVDFLRLTDDRVLIPELSNSEKIRKLITQIRDRDLWRRALIISRQTMPESMHNKAGGTRKALFPGFRHLAGNEPERIRRRREIAAQVWQTAGKPCERHEVWLDVPKPPAMHEAKDMWIHAPGEEHPRTLGDYIPIAKWVELYGMHQWRSHVFCPAHCVKQVGEAAEHVLKDRFGLEFLPVARAYTHMPA